MPPVFIFSYLFIYLFTLTIISATYIYTHTHTLNLTLLLPFVLFFVGAGFRRRYILIIINEFVAAKELGVGRSFECNTFLRASVDVVAVAVVFIIIIRLFYSPNH